MNETGRCVDKLSIKSKKSMKKLHEYARKKEDDFNLMPKNKNYTMYMHIIKTKEGKYTVGTEL